MKTKKCTKCGIEKPLTAEYYYRNASRASGFQSCCKVCRKNSYDSDRSEYFADYYQKNKEYFAEHDAKYYQENKEAINARNRKYHHDNKEREAKRAKKYYKEHAEERRAYAKKWSEERKAKQPACVYQILNKVNGKFYIGETLYGELRFKRHLSRLRANHHVNPKLQADFDKFGEEAFEWSIIKEVDKDKETLLLEEIRTIDSFLTQGKELYNLSLTIEQLKLLQEDK